MKFLLRPNDRVVLRELLMAEMTRKPFATALELQRNDVRFAVVMGAARFIVDVDTIDLDAADYARHRAPRSRGQTSTSTDAIMKQAIMTMNPIVNDPVL